ncbi:MAG: hypothetical protein QM752_02250 [Gammaproteobacteria bacterium]
MDINFLPWHDRLYTLRKQQLRKMLVVACILVSGFMVLMDYVVIHVASVQQIRLRQLQALYLSHHKNILSETQKNWLERSLQLTQNSLQFLQTISEMMPAHTALTSLVSQPTGFMLSGISASPAEINHLIEQYNLLTHRSSLQLVETIPTENQSNSFAFKLKWIKL